MRVICEHCKTSFESSFVFSNLVVFMSDCGETCPNCGLMTSIPNEVFSTDEQGKKTLISKLELLDANSLNRINNAIKDFQKGKAGADKLRSVMVYNGIDEGTTRAIFNGDKINHAYFAMFIFVISIVLSSKFRSTYSLHTKSSKSDKAMTEIKNVKYTDVESKRHDARREYLKYIRDRNKKSK